MSLVLVLSGISSVAVAQPDRSVAQTRQCNADAGRTTVSQAAYRNGGARQRAMMRNHVNVAELKARRACRGG
ncbi:hypothetical protein [Asticcacaulis sp. AC402]|uniref:hypothetical protein n=1 Tax=Asticcacaulis sp. AC402 TaxID=1282361 RepID=UPI00138AC11C|nr:hypothetical protein [Asticcacaulis sp. AC402]